MSRTVSPGSGKPYGLARVCRVWRTARATVYRHRAPPRQSARQRPGPVGAMPDAAGTERSGPGCAMPGCAPPGAGCCG